MKDASSMRMRIAEKKNAKREILNYLKGSSYVSGQELGESIGITRSAVWKHVQELRKQGYRIESVPSKGYCLTGVPDRLLPEELKASLHTRVLGREIVYQEEVSSTQELARIAATQAAPEGTIVVAEIQRGGRGRIGRTWASPFGGIYFSILLRPDIKPTEALRVPLLAGIAVARSIGKCTGLRPQLKWPNDIILSHRKVGGILAEMSAEVDRLNWIIIGIGLNVNMTLNSIPEDLEGIATSIRIETGNEISRVHLLQQILIEMEALYDEYKRHGFDPLRRTWKSMSNTIGADVVIRSPSEEVSGKAVDIDMEGALLLEREDGSRERIVAGDVSLRNLT